MNTRMTCSLFVLLIGIATVAGCNKEPQSVGPTDPASENTTAENDPLDIPMTDEEIASLKQSVSSYADALTKIKSFRDKICAAVTSGDVHTSHRPLDELDVLLDHVTTVVRDSNIPKSQWETVNTSVQELRDLFSGLHAQIDAGEKADYEAIAADIAAALEKLDSAQPES